MAKRNPASQHQMTMGILFGRKADQMPTDWTQWPEPQRSIYSRMLSKKYCFVNSKALAAAGIAVSKIQSAAAIANECLAASPVLKLRAADAAHAEPAA